MVLSFSFWRVGEDSETGASAADSNGICFFGKSSTASIMLSFARQWVMLKSLGILKQNLIYKKLTLSDIGITRQAWLPISRTVSELLSASSSFACKYYRFKASSDFYLQVAS